AVARRLAAVRLRWLPFVRRAPRRCALFSARSAVRYQPGWRLRVPCERGANAAIPRSMPVCCPVSCKGWISAAAHEELTYHPFLCSADPAGVGRALRGAAPARRDAPIVERTSKPLSRVAPLPYSW